MSEAPTIPEQLPSPDSPAVSGWESWAILLIAVLTRRLADVERRLAALE